MDKLIEWLIANLPLLLRGLPWGTSGVLALVLVYLFLFPEKAERVGSWIYRGLRGVGSFFEKGYVATDIQASINTYQRGIEAEVAGILPYPVSIHWVKEMDPQAFIQGGTCIVRMHRSDLRAENLVTATVAYVGQVTLPVARRYLDRSVSKGIDMAMTRRLLLGQSSPEAFHAFQDSVLGPLVREDQSFAEMYRPIEALDDNGFLTRVLLREFLELGRLLFPREADPSMAAETVRFVRFLSDIATKESTDVPLDFRGSLLSVNVLLVARHWKLELHGLDPYVNRVEEAAKRGADAVYVCARGDNVGSAREVATILAHKRIGLQRKKGREYRVRFMGEIVQAVVIPFMRRIRVRPVHSRPRA